MPLLYEIETVKDPIIQNVAINPILGRSQLTLEIKSSGTGFYACIYAKKQLIAQTQSFKNSSKATQEGYRQIDCIQQEGQKNNYTLFN